MFPSRANEVQVVVCSWCHAGLCLLHSFSKYTDFSLVSLLTRPILNFGTKTTSMLQIVASCPNSTHLFFAFHIFPHVNK